MVFEVVTVTSSHHPHKIIVDYFPIAVFFTLFIILLKTLILSIVPVLQESSRLLGMVITSSAPFWRATRTRRSKRFCPSRITVLRAWTRPGISPRAWRTSRWRRRSRRPDLWPSSTSSFRCSRTTPCVWTWWWGNWRTRSNLSPCSAALCSTRITHNPEI